jgi:hypothetical protein
LLLQILYSIRSERLLIEEMDYNILYWWFVGLRPDDPIWDATTGRGAAASVRSLGRRDSPARLRKCPLRDPPPPS